MPEENRDAIATLAATGLLAYVSADIGHHALGHGAACLASGGRIVSLSSIFVHCSMTGAAIDLAGPLANVVLGAVAMLALRSMPRASARWRLFAILVAAFNLFWAELQLVFSAATRTDDWAWPMHVFHVGLAGRFAMIVFGAAAYLGTVRAVAVRMAPFACPVARARKIAGVAWLTAGAIACATAAFDPEPAAAILRHAAPQSLLLAMGLLFVPSMAARTTSAVQPAGAIGHSWPWVIAAVAAGIASIAFFGPGFAVGT